MERPVEDLPVLGPLVTLMGWQAVGEKPRLHPMLPELLEVAGLTKHHLPGEPSVHDGHLWHGADPGDARHAVLLDGVVEERHDVGDNVVAA